MRSETLAKLNKSAFDNFENIVSAVGLNIGVVNLHRLGRPAVAAIKDAVGGDQLRRVRGLGVVHDRNRIGLVNRLAPAGEALSTAVAFAETLAVRPALASSLIRAGVRDSLEQTTAQAIQRTLADSHRVFTGDIEEGIAAFFEKRAPAFKAGRNGA